MQTYADWMHCQLSEVIAAGHAHLRCPFFRYGRKRQILLQTLHRPWTFLSKSIRNCQAEDKGEEILITTIFVLPLNQYVTLKIQLKLLRKIHWQWRYSTRLSDVAVFAIWKVCTFSSQPRNSKLWLHNQFSCRESNAESVFGLVSLRIRVKFEYQLK